MGRDGMTQSNRRCTLRGSQTFRSTVAFECLCLGILFRKRVREAHALDRALCVAILTSLGSRTPTSIRVGITSITRAETAIGSCPCL